MIHLIFKIYYEGAERTSGDARRICPKKGENEP